MVLTPSVHHRRNSQGPLSNLANAVQSQKEVLLSWTRQTCLQSDYVTLVAALQDQVGHLRSDCVSLRSKTSMVYTYQSRFSDHEAFAPMLA